MDYIPVEDNKDLGRDPSSHAIVNTNSKEYEKAVANYKRLRAEKEKIASMETDINNIKEDLGDIKNLLQQLLTKGN